MLCVVPGESGINRRELMQTPDDVLPADAQFALGLSFLEPKDESAPSLSIHKCGLDDELLINVENPTKVSCTDFRNCQAVYWFEKAAAQGHPDATYRLANCKFHGWGCKAHERNAFALYEKAANLVRPNIVNHVC